MEKVIKKIKAFFYIAKNSIISTKYYQEILKTDFKFSVKYVLSIVILFSTISSIFFGTRAFLAAKQFISEGVVNLRQSFPDDFVFTMESGSWNLNQEMPYVIPITSVRSADEEEPQDSSIDNLVVFYKEGTIEDLDVFKSVALINQNNVLVKDSEGVRAYSLKDFPDFVLNKQVFNNVVDKALVFVKFLPLIITVASFFVVALGTITTRAIYLLFISAMLHLITKAMKMNLSYKDVLRISAHTMTFPLLLSLVFVILNFDPVIPAWFFAINFFMALIVISDLKKSLKA